MLITRELPPAEWPKLAGTELEQVWPVLTPEAKVIVVEDDDGAIVGCWALMQFWHAEGVWIAPAYQKRTSVARRLWMGMRGLAAKAGVVRVITAAADAPMVALLDKHGTKLPAQEYVLCLQ
jgi:hypothetical protein